MARRYEFRVSKEHAGLRLDQAIAAHEPSVSRTLAKKALFAGGVYLDKKRVKVASREVREGQLIRVILGEGTSAHPSKEVAGEIVIVHESKSVLVVDKPSGMFSAATQESDRNHLLAFLQEMRPAEEFFLIHRLDRPTSGLLVLAKNRAAAGALSADVADHKIERVYRAILVGPTPEQHTEESPLEGKPAKTAFQVEARAEAASLCRVELFTGRTHQVRLHALAMGCPVAGDSKYGRDKTRSLPLRPPRLCLHAEHLTFTDPDSKKSTALFSPLPLDLKKYWENLKSLAGTSA